MAKHASPEFSDRRPQPVPKDQMPELSTEIVWGIIGDTITEKIAHQLVWEALGYRWDEAAHTWDASQTIADWGDAYPKPPLFIDSRPATVKLTRSIPKANKKLLMDELGFEGYKVNELTPRKTRRATVANWLLGYLRSQGNF